MQTIHHLFNASLNIIPILLLMALLWTRTLQHSTIGPTRHMALRRGGLLFRPLPPFTLACEVLIVTFKALPKGCPTESPLAALL
jgi:hypothetical protein